MMIANMRLLSLWLYNVYHYNLVLYTHIENDQCWSKRCVQQEADVIENQTLLLVFQMCSVATLSYMAFLVAFTFHRMQILALRGQEERHTHTLTLLVEERVFYNFKTILSASFWISHNTLSSS